MRPHELTLDGFRSYAATTTISWEGRRLVGIVGPIGSGKSSILDGIAFALYGRTPRLGVETKGLINQRRDEGKVAFTFSVDGTVWRVVRALRRRGAAAHALYRVGPDGDEEVTDKAREVTERVTDLLGLDYDGFRRSILLAQNQFSEFLEATDTDRNGVLRGVFGFERLDGMREAAKARRDAAAAGLTALARLREQSDLDRRDLDEAAAGLAEAAAAADRLEAALGPVAEHQSSLDRALAELQALEATREQIGRLADRIPGREQSESLLGRADAAGRAAAAAEEALAGATAAEAAGRARFEEAIEAAGGRETLEQAAELLARRAEQLAAVERARKVHAEAADSLTAVAAARDQAVAAAAAAVAAHAAAAGVLSAAVGARQAAEEARHEATHRDLAAGLRRSLHEGDRCPVCEQVVPSVPAVTDPGLEQAEAAHAAAVRAEEAARSAESSASRDAAAGEAASTAAAAGLERASREAARAAAAVVDAEEAADRSADAAARLLGDAADPADVLAARREAIAVAEKDLADASAAVRKAAADVDAARREVSSSSRDIEGLLTLLAELAARLGLEGVAPTGDPGVLRDVLQAVREAWMARMQESEQRAGELSGVVASAEEGRSAALAAAGLEAGADPSVAVAAARERRAVLEARVADLTRRLGDLTRLEEEQADLVSRHDLYQRLFDDLAPSRFPAFVLDDRRRALAALGSERFEYLSAGRYRFTDDGDFDIVDLTAADLTRSAASLSGGETFLASLALALALAEIVARQGGRLDAFFLDEGFGSLDEEHVDLAMEGIERLATEGTDRLIVVVSHVASLRDRLEDLIVLAKDEVTGDTAVRSGSAAG